MTTPNRSRFRLAATSLLLAFVATALFPVRALAQSSGTGTIQGRVYNPASKEYVKDAEVRLDGTNQLTYSTQDGSFEFIGVPAGSASITVNYSGYSEARESFNVGANRTAVREVNLVSTVASPGTTGKDGVVKLEAFQVSSAREGNSKAVAAQRRDMNIITSVSSDVFGEVMNGNVGEFLKYLPGVDLQYSQSDARGVRLGGMDQQYTAVSTDGIRTASADASLGGGAVSRATSFEGFSITSIESVEVFRTTSPENDADSPAGTINFRTKRAFDRKGRVFNYSYSANFNGEEYALKKTPGVMDARENYLSYKWRPNWQASYAESFNNQRFGLLLSASHNSSWTEQYSSTIDYSRTPETTAPAGVTRGPDTRPLVARSISFGDGPGFLVKDALLLTADWKATPRLTLSLNLTYSYSEFNFWNRSFGFTAANNNANINNGRSTVGGDGVLTIVGTRAATGSVNNVAAVSNGGGSSVKSVYTRQYAPRFEYKHGALTVDGSLAYSKSKNNYDAVERGLIQSEGGNIASGFTATRPNAQSWEWTIRQTSGPDWFDLRNQYLAETDTRAGGTRVNNDDRVWITEKYTGALNATWAVPFLQRFPTTMKFGGKWDEESRNNRTDTEMNIWSYIGPGGNTVRSNPTTFAVENATFGNWANVGPQFVSPFPFDMGTTNALAGGGVTSLGGKFGMIPRVSRSEVANLFHAHPELFVNTMTPENFYTDQYVNARRFRQTINALYWQADTRLTPQITVRFGVRGEQTKNALKERDPLTLKQLDALGVPHNLPAVNGGRPFTIAGMRTMFETNPFVTRRSEYTEWFPSLMAKYQITPNFELIGSSHLGI